MPVTHQLSRFGVGSLAIPLFRPDHHHRPPPPPPTFDHLLPTTHTAAYTSHPAPQSLHTGAHITATCARHRRTRSGVPASVAPAHRIASQRSAAHRITAQRCLQIATRTHRRARTVAHSTVRRRDTDTALTTTYHPPPPPPPTAPPPPLRATAQYRHQPAHHVADSTTVAVDTAPLTPRLLLRRRTHAQDTRGTVGRGAIDL